MKDRSPDVLRFFIPKGKRAHEPITPNICIQTSHKGSNFPLFEQTRKPSPHRGEGGWPQARRMRGGLGELNTSVATLISHPYG